MQESGGVVVGVGLDYWLKWQVPVCALIMIIPAAVALKLITNNHHHHHHYHDGPLSMQDLWVPCWSNLNPKWLLVYRAFAFLTMSYLLYKMLLFAGLFAFYFYTQWTFTLVILYFAVATVVSARGCFMSSYKLQTPKQEAGFLGSALLAIYQTSAGASILTDLVFWCILMPMMAGKDFQLTLVIVCIHSLNAVFLIIDSLLNALPFPWFGFNYFMLWTVTYALFQWVLHACGFPWWPYPFLELSTPWAPLWYLGIAVVHIPCYGLYILIVKAKNSILSRLFPRVFIRPHGEILDDSKTD
ncbi:uncharacterized protein LOC141652424 isoform X2 [Silene latifolia]|uniref:uncharacterized protein LOC141652424 isoform X2 n=1 Tax=Silene latifolia TaxID=37657 RepID=UPI003D7771CE